MNHQQQSRFCIYLCIVGFLLTILCSCASSKPTQKDVFALLQIKTEEITSIEVGYKDCFYPLIKETRENLIEDLSASVPIEIKDAHEYIPSEYTVRFVLNSGKSVDACFCFFSGLVESDSLDASGGSRLSYVDTRYDIKIGETIYHFRFSPDHYWTEDDSRAAFDWAAKAKGAPSRTKLDGFDDVLNPQIKSISKSWTWESVIDSADLVVLARYHTKIGEPYFADTIGSFGLVEGYLYNPRLYDLFSIQEVIKGSWPSDSIYIPAYVSGRVVTDDYGRQYSQYILPDVRDPEYQEDEVYLLCLTCKDDLQVYTGYGRTVSAVVLDEGYLYPRYNTEYHPFAGVSLDQVKDYCRQ